MIHKPHTWIELDKIALEHNLYQLKKNITPGVLAPVIKGNAYGHGLLEVGRVCQESPHVDWLCVASLSEALTLRKSGITKPILVLVYLDDDEQHAIEHDIDVMVYNADAIEHLHACAKKQKKICNIHIKIDTGLSRLGVAPEKAVPFLRQAQSLPFLSIRGIATHFAESHTADQEFTKKQIQKFSSVISSLEQNEITIPFKHACNTAATLRFKPMIGNFFRPGVAVYGSWPSKHIEQITDISLSPVLTWKSKIFDIKTVPAEHFVGYDRIYKTNKKTKLATIPVGYADGYDKRLENKGHIFVGNMLVPIVGKIGMNIITIDITDVPDARIGSDVILIGDSPGVRVDDLAQKIDANPREITTRISPHIPRIVR